MRALSSLSSRPCEAGVTVPPSRCRTGGHGRLSPARPPHIAAPRRPPPTALPTTTTTLDPPSTSSPSSSSSSSPPSSSYADSMAAYADLKTRLSRRARKAGAGLAAYLFLTVSGTAAAAALAGTAAGAAYLALLYRDADALTPETAVPLMAAQAEQNPWARRVKVLAAAYYHALANPRLGVVVALGAAVGLGASATGRTEPPVLEAGCLLLGFLSYKVALLLELWDELKPKVDAEAGLRPVRPAIPDLPPVAGWDEEPAPVVEAPAEGEEGGVGGLLRKVLPPKQP